jgi:atypical dual specificity phosphatase
MGISRSATIVCAYLVATMGMTGPEALLFVQAKRSMVCPNIGFRNQLEVYEKGFIGGRAEGGTPSKAKLSESIAKRIQRLKLKAGK